MRHAGQLIRLVYALCLTGATANHVRTIVARGWWPPHLPSASAIYWSSLTVLDPLAVILLLVRPRAGIAMTAAIIVSNVIHNLWFMAAYPLRGSLLADVLASPFMLSQIAFLLFVAATARMAWDDRNEGAR